MFYNAYKTNTETADMNVLSNEVKVGGVINLDNDIALSRKICFIFFTICRLQYTKPI